MRRVIVLVSLLAVPGAAQAQVGAAGPSDRGPVASPSYRYEGIVVEGPPRAAGPVYVWNGRPVVRRNGLFNRRARYFYYPHYPGYRAPPEVRAPVQLPRRRFTPYDDPYFEERILFDEWGYYWGW